MRTTANELPHLLKERRQPPARLLYPALIIAAIIVTLVSLLGIAGIVGISGYLPAATVSDPVVANGARVLADNNTKPVDRPLAPRP